MLCGTKTCKELIKAAIPQVKPFEWEMGNNSAKALKWVGFQDKEWQIAVTATS